MACNSLRALSSRITQCGSVVNTKVSKQICRNNIIFAKHREPPNGFLFNRKPLKPGEKRVREEWELIWYTGWGVSLAVLAVGFYFRPNNGLLDWARQEAEIRLAEEEAAAGHRRVPRRPHRPHPRGDTEGVQAIRPGAHLRAARRGRRAGGGHARAAAAVGGRRRQDPRGARRAA